MFLAHDPTQAMPCRPHLLQALGRDGRAAAEALLGLCPAHRPTPLHRLPAMAHALGVGAIMVKDEGFRLGLRSFKALGGAYAVMRCCSIGRRRLSAGRSIRASSCRRPSVRSPRA